LLPLYREILSLAYLGTPCFYQIPLPAHLIVPVDFAFIPRHLDMSGIMTLQVGDSNMAHYSPKKLPTVRDCPLIEVRELVETINRVFS
jgi:hypothetical protein